MLQAIFHPHTKVSRTGRLCVVVKTASLVLDFVNDIAVAALIMPFVGWFLAVRSASIVITMVLV